MIFAHGHQDLWIWSQFWICQPMSLYYTYEYIHVSMIPNAEGSLRHWCIESQTSLKFDIRFVFSSPPSRLRRAKVPKVPGGNSCTSFGGVLLASWKKKHEFQGWFRTSAGWDWEFQRQKIETHKSKNALGFWRQRVIAGFPHPLISTIRSPKIKCSTFLFVAYSL